MFMFIWVQQHNLFDFSQNNIVGKQFKYQLIQYNIQIDRMDQTSTASCQIFGIVGVIVQLILGALSFSVLIIKRYREHPKRPWRIWAMDTSKQGVSQLIAHFINVGISLLLSTHLDNDACIWYFTTNVLDNTVGVFICCGVLTLVQNTIIAGKCQQFRSGNYYDIIEYNDQYMSTYTRDDTTQSRSSAKTQLKPMQISSKKKIIIVSYFAWIIQFVIWNLIVAVCKSLLFTFQLLLNRPLNAISQFFLGWVQPYPNLQLVLVIIIIPVIMNGLAFWIQDNFLKKKEQTHGENKNIKEPLM